MLLPEGRLLPHVTDLGGCIASHRVMVDRAPIRWMYRSHPVWPGDSGWRFFSGDEDDADMVDPDCFGIYAVEAITAFDPSIVPWLFQPIGSTLERDEATQGFVEAVAWRSVGLR
ncbi:DUF2185 domain-containing protein [Cognatilysobacter terrigena]|uniref:DUF2185 domain-containing protein n=1 Tax=Cognatilysobacter terrigena TaxID=2488749 RepID=UPI001414DC1D|nr:DUF2185 domain-containing protein [Lysobacter terrigena]